METRSAKLGVFVTNKRKGLFAVTSIAKDEILIDLNWKETLPSPTRRSLQIGEGKHVFRREETVDYLNHGANLMSSWISAACVCELSRTFKQAKKLRSITPAQSMKCMIVFGVIVGRQDACG
jgi:hypothetical protein